MIGTIFNRDTRSSNLKPGRIMKAVQYDSVNGKLIDQDGAAIIRPIYPAQYINADGVGYFSHAELSSACSIVSKHGTGTPGFATAGRMTLTLGTLWDFEILWPDSVVTKYHFASKTGLTSATCYDTSGFRRDLVAVGFSSIDSMCANSLLFGSDVINLHGYSEKENLIDGLPASTSSMGIQVSNDGFLDISKLTSGESSSVTVLTSVVRPTIETTSMVFTCTLRKLQNSQNSSVDIGWYSSGFSGHIATIVSGPGSATVTNKSNSWVSITGLSETEDTTIKIVKDNFTIGQSAVPLSIYAGSIHSKRIGDGCRMKDLQVCEGDKPSQYTNIRRTVKSIRPPLSNGSPVSLGKVVCIGDSLTNGWVPTVANYAKSTTFVQAGIGGNTTAQVLGRFAQDVVSVSPDIVIIVACTNDIFEKVNLSVIQNNLLQCITLAKNAGIEPIIATPVPFGALPSWNQVMQDKVDALNVWVKSLGYMVVDFYTKLRDGATNNLKPAWDSGDRLHPNSLGKVAQATAVIATLPFLHQPADVLGETLVNQGRVKYSPSLSGPLFGAATTYTLPEAPELIEALGANSVWYNADGTAKTVNDATFRANCNGPKLFANPDKPERGVVVYSDSSGPIKAALGIDV